MPANFARLGVKKKNVWLGTRHFKCSSFNVQCPLSPLGLPVFWLLLVYDGAANHCNFHVSRDKYSIHGMGKNKIGLITLPLSEKLNYVMAISITKPRLSDRSEL